MSSPTKATIPFLHLRPASSVKALSILVIFIVIISYSYWSHLDNLAGTSTHHQAGSENSKPVELADYGWTKKIWQTSKHPAGKTTSQNNGHMKTWTDLNPEYQHTLLTDESMISYVKDHFHASNPDIETTFMQAKDFAFQLDLIKYLVLWAEGGVYSDMDTTCIKAISQWVPPQYLEKAGIVLGVQIESRDGPDDSFYELFLLADWTITSKPNQPFLWFLYQHLTNNLKHVAAQQAVTASNNRPHNVYEVTGRIALTRAFLAYATSVTATKVTDRNFTMMTEPMLIGEILVLPVQAFAAVQEDGTELVHHYGAKSYESDPWDKLQPPVDKGTKKIEEEAKKKAEEEKTKVEEEKTKAEEEKKKLEEEKKKVEEEEKKVEEEKEKVEEEEKKVEEEKKKQQGTKATEVIQNKEEETAQAKENPATNNKPPSVQYENAQVEDNITEKKPTTSDSNSQGSEQEKSATKSSTIVSHKGQEDEVIAEKQRAQIAAKAKADAQARLEQEKKDAEAKKKVEEDKKQLSEVKAKAEEEKKKAEAAKKKTEEEEAKKKNAEPKWAPLNEPGRLEPSNDLADYGSEFVPTN